MMSKHYKKQIETIEEYLEETKDNCETLEEFLEDIHEAENEALFFAMEMTRNYY